MKAVQLSLGVVGVAVGTYGVWLLLERPEDLIAVSSWLAGGVVLHDALLAPLVLGVCLLGSRLLPTRFHVPAVLTLTIFGSLTLIAIPVLGGFGAKSDNPTLLDRNYLLGWLVLGALTLVGTLLVGAVSARKHALPIPAAEATEIEPEEG
jgi:hypothetical protein